MDDDITDIERQEQAHAIVILGKLLTEIQKTTTGTLGGLIPENTFLRALARGVQALITPLPHYHGNLTITELLEFQNNLRAKNLENAITVAARGLKGA
jgi:hypothetical protein